MSNVSDCPATDRLYQYLLGLLPEQESLHLEEHLLACPSCATTVDGLSVEDRFTRTVRSGASLYSSRSPAVEELMNQLRLLRSDMETTATFQEGQTAGGPGEPVVGLREVLAPPQAADEIGRLGGYRVLRVLGKGGMGVVFHAEDVQLGRPVALKVIKHSLAAKPHYRQRFLREARAAAQIKSDHAVPIYHVGEDRGVPFLAMELLHGQALDQWLRQGCRPTLAELLRLGREIATGLAAAHDRGLVHRDIKPGNIWLEGPTGRVKLLDFGLARPVADGPQLTHRGALIGTPAYMAPEQAEGKLVDARADLFSLGCVLYQLATGRLPFAGETTLAVLNALATQAPRPVREINPALPEELAALIMQLLVKQPDQRPESARVVAESFQRMESQRASAAAVTSSSSAGWVTKDGLTAGEFAETQPESARRAEAARDQPAKPARPSGRKQAGLAAGLLLAVLVGGGILFGSTLVRYATNKGMLVVEVNSPDLKVSIEQNGVIVWEPTTKREFVLTAGEGEVVVHEKGSGMKVATRKFTLSRGGKETIAIWVDRAVAPPPPVKVEEKPARDAQRQAAEWVLSVGGWVHVKMAGQNRDVHTGDSFPAEEFQVVTVHLSRAQLTDAGLANLKGLNHLKVLYLDNPSVSDAGMQHLAALASLTSLSLGTAQVSDAGLRHLQPLSRLAGLSLVHTQVGDAGLAHLKGLSLLGSLDLSDTRVSDAGLAHLKGLSNLETLELNGTQVGDAGLAHLAGLANLAILQLGDTRVSDAGLVHLKGLSKLRGLSLEGTQVGDAGLEHLQGLRSLYGIFLGRTRVSDVGLQHLQPLLPGFGNLKLEQTQVSDAGLALLGRSAKHLRWLELAGTRISEAGLKNLEGETLLRWLDLSHTQIGDTGLVHLQRMSQLETLNLSGTGVSDTGLKQLAALPVLTKLGLAHTRVSDSGLEHLLPLAKLRDLDLTGTRVSTRGYTSISGKPIAEVKWSEPNLTAARKVLALGGSIKVRQGGKEDLAVTEAARLPVEYFKMTRANLAGVKQPLGELLPLLAALTDPTFDALEAVDLADTTVADTHLKTLSPLTRLANLSLARTGVGDEGVKHLHGLSGLRELDLAGTKVTAAGLAALQKALPNCRIGGGPRG